MVLEIRAEGDDLGSGDESNLRLLRVLRVRSFASGSYNSSA